MDRTFIQRHRFVSSCSPAAEGERKKEKEEKKNLLRAIWKYSPKERNRVDLFSDCRMNMSQSESQWFHCNVLSELLLPRVYPSPRDGTQSVLNLLLYISVEKAFKHIVLLVFTAFKLILFFKKNHNFIFFSLLNFLIQIPKKSFQKTNSWLPSFFFFFWFPGPFVSHHPVVRLVVGWDLEWFTTLGTIKFLRPRKKKSIARKQIKKLNLKLYLPFKLLVYKSLHSLCLG